MKFNVLAVFFILQLHIAAQDENSRFVDPFIGTGGTGHTFPGPVWPSGMVQLGPDTRNDASWEGCSGYYYNDSLIYGFSHTHLSGTGVSDWGDILLSPTTGAPTLDKEIYRSGFSHTNEKAEAGYYQVRLADDDILAELTVTPRTGIHRYTFPKTSEANIILDLMHRDKLLAGNITIEDSCTVSGYRVSEGWAKKQEVYFVIRFSKPFKKYALGTAGKFSTDLNKLIDRPEGAFFQFNTEDGKQLVVKVGISSTGIEGAKKNLDKEAASWDFSRYREEAKQAWNTRLSCIQIPAGDEDKKTVFYTALYHCFIHPSLNMDVDGKYRGWDNAVHTAKGYTNYTVFSLWDTYRALHPLLNILDPAKSRDCVNSLLEHYKQSGRLPVWELSSNETDCMIGFHAVSVIADALAKNIKPRDIKLCYEACKAAASYSGSGIPKFNDKSFLQVDDESESVSKTLEYAYDNWCIAQIAGRAGKKTDAALFTKRSKGYVSLFDPKSGFMRPRANGKWLEPFNPAEVNNHFTEANSWQYSFSVPHDLQGLITLYGGTEKLEQKLNALFAAPPTLAGRDQPDVTGLIGQYAHGNEPSHHIAYLYNYTGNRAKTADIVKHITDNFYRNAQDGLIGNDDCGQMSAWYIFSAMGVYPVCPGNNEYAAGMPLFDEIIVKLQGNKKLRISKNNSTGSFVFNSKPVEKLSYDVFAKGGELVFMIPGPAKLAETRSVSLPPPAPLITGDKVFSGSATIQINSPDNKEYKFIYTNDRGNRKKYVPYNGPVKIDTNTSFFARTIAGTDTSGISEAGFYRLRHNFDVTIKSRLNSQYSADNGRSLLDGIFGDKDWRRGDWLGTQFSDFIFEMDLKESKPISYLSLNCLQDTRSWILFPVHVNYYVSENGTDYTLLGTVDNTTAADDYEVQVKKFTLQLPSEIKPRYLKVVAESAGKLPDWHAGKGGGAFIFADELELR